ncbi:MAG: hypothetical protein H6706_03260 [Myxococcales bacterium]|nr:hypothetical protein [Myxococcales bacterium]
MAATLRIEVEEFRYLSPRTGLSLAMYDVVVKVSDDRFAFAPTEAHHALVLGVLGRARQLMPDVDVYGFHVMSNHLHLLIGAATLGDKARFLAWSMRELSKRTNRRLGRTGKLLEQNRCTQVTSAAHALQRLRYLMGQATAQFLARHPHDDIFPSSTPALLHGRPLPATFRYAGAEPIDCPLHIDRLPGLEDLSPAEHRALMGRLADDLAREARPRRKKAGVRLPRPEQLRRLDPMTRPRARQRSPKPVVHGSAEHAALWRARHAEARAGYTEATQAFQRWHHDPTQPLLPWPACTLPPAFAQRHLRPGPA